jgi:uncharacterized coiled-coil protein SlyX
MANMKVIQILDRMGELTLKIGLQEKSIQELMYT